MVRIRVLGTLEAEDDRGTIDLGGPRQRAVLALLLVARGDVVPVDRLIDDLWHGDPPPRAVGALQAYVSNLRRALEPHRAPRTPSTLLVSRPPGYAVTLPPECVDAWEFERSVRAADTADPALTRRSLERALALWRGPAYAQFVGASWTVPETTRLDELRLVAHERLAAAIVATGDAAAAVLEAQTLTREHPLREEGWRLLALALHASGRQADALAALRSARVLLADELGLDPGPALTELQGQILTSTVPCPIRAPRPPARSNPVPDGPPTAPFVGREAELAALHETARTVTASPRVVLLSGEPGAGKSALLHHFRRDLHAAGWRVPFGRCPEVDGAPPAWAWVEVLRALTDDVDPGRLTTALTPLLDEQNADRPESDAAVGRFLLHRAVADYLASACADRPLAVLLDDIHRADEETLTLLTRVAQHRFPTLLVVTYRPDEAPERLEEALATLARLHPVRIRLRGLDTDRSAQLVRQVSGLDPDPRVLRAIADRTGGNPFYLCESARLLGSEGELVAISEVPEGVRDVLRRRLARLPESTVSVLRLAAVAGRESEVELLAHAAEVDEDTVLDALEAGIGAGLLEEPCSGSVRFTHALVRDTLYTDLPRLRRSRWHARVAAALERLQPSDSAALAHHFTEALSAATARQALEHNAAAAAQAVGRYAHDAAIGHFEAALIAADHLPPGALATVDERVELLSRLSRTQLAAGATVAAHVTRNRALSTARSAGRTDLLIRTLTAWDTPTPWLNRRYGEVDDGVVATIEELLRAPDLDPSVRCRLLVALVYEIEGERGERTGEAAREAEALARAADDPLLLGLALTAVTTTAGTELSAHRRAALATEMIDLGSGEDLAAFAMLGHHVRGRAAASGGDLDAVRRHMDRAHALADRYRWRQAQGAREMTRGLIAHCTGDLAGAERYYRAGHDVIVRSGGQDAHAVLALALLTLRITDGRVGEFEGAIRTVDTTALDAVADPLALALVANGRPEEARRVRQQIRPVRPDFFRSLLLSIRGMAVSAVGERAEAGQVYAELVEYQGQIGGADTGSVAVGPTDTVLGDLATLLGRPQDAHRHYAVALELARRCGNRYWTGAARARVTALREHA